MKIIENETHSNGCISQAYGKIEEYTYKLMYDKHSDFRVCYLFNNKGTLIAFNDKQRCKSWPCDNDNLKNIISEIYKHYGN